MNKQQLLKQHNDWLRKMGVSTDKPKKPKGIYPIPDYSTSKVATSDKVGNGFKKASNTYSGSNNLIVGLAYNKGNYVVLSKEEASDPATGKRR
jgi:hypothetical protein